MTQPIEISPTAFYDDGHVRLILGVPCATLARARREGALTHVRRGGRLFYRGQWLIDWLSPRPNVAPSESKP